MAEDFSAALTAGQAGNLPDLLGLEWKEARPGLRQGPLDVAKHHMAPNGFLHAASVIALADSACGYGCMVSLPEGARLHHHRTEVELPGHVPARAAAWRCEAKLVHGGRNTQVWDAVVTAEATGKTIALFRCTQMVLLPKA
jgi:1,4-dihydroxy-2-naphthoyl-CoA hydrolase